MGISCFFNVEVSRLIFFYDPESQCRTPFEAFFYRKKVVQELVDNFNKAWSKVKDVPKAGSLYHSLSLELEQLNVIAQKNIDFTNFEIISLEEVKHMQFNPLRNH